MRKSLRGECYVPSKPSDFIKLELIKNYQEAKKMNEESKPIWQSRTLWGVVVMVIAAVVDNFGYKIDGGEQVDLIDFITMAITAGAGLFAAYGRIIATKKIQ